MKQFKTKPEGPVPPEAMYVLEGLQSAGHEAYLVGGCVRDRMIGRPVNDWDIATNAVPEAVVATFPKTIPTGLQHGTVTVMHLGEPIEVTTYRVEIGFTDGRRPDEVRFTRRLEDDLSRRDFTVNAMAWDPINDVVVDPFGGQQDLVAKSLRAVGRARDRFDEDGLRAMRAVRFAAVLDFEIEDETWTAIPQTLTTFAKVSVERVQVEFTKTLKSQRGAWGLNALRESGLLAGFLPAVADLNAEDWAQTCAAVDAVEGLERRLAALFWRLAPGAAESATRHLRYPNDVIRHVAGLHGLRDVSPDVTDPPAVRALAARVGRAALDDWLAVAHAHAADPVPWTALEKRIEACGARTVPHKAKELAIDGRRVMTALSLKPSRRLGLILERLLRRVWADPELNTTESLLALLPEVSAEVPES